jgi:hypothetical protein
MMITNQVIGWLTVMDKVALLDWLLEADDNRVRYNTLVNILDKPGDSTEVLEVRRAMRRRTRIGGGRRIRPPAPSTHPSPRRGKSKWVSYRVLRVLKLAGKRE